MLGAARFLRMTKRSNSAQPDLSSSEVHAPMNALEFAPTSTEASGKTVLQIASALIASAVATFDADRNASRSYLLRASAILQTCVAHEAVNGARASQSGLAKWQLQRILDYIEQHLADRITADDLANLIDTSVGQLFRAFKASVGIPPLHYVACRRLEFACSLMQTTREPLSHIALTAGFFDQSHFCRVFRRVLGATPAAWRRVNRADPKPRAGESRESISPFSVHETSMHAAKAPQRECTTSQPGERSHVGAAKHRHRRALATWIR